MKNLRVGKVAITPKGEWKDGVSYEMLDAVYYNGDSYISVSDRNKSKPTDNSSWKILAKGSMDGVKVVNREWFGVFDNKNNFFTIDDNGSVTYASYAANPSEITIKNPIRIEFDGDNYQSKVYLCKRDEVQGGGQPIEIDTLSTHNGKYVFEFTPNNDERKYIRIGIICSGVVNVKVSELFIMTSAYIYNGINSKVSKTDIVQSTGTSESAVMSQKAVTEAFYTKTESDDRYLHGEVLYEDYYYPNMGETTDKVNFTDSTEILQPTKFIGEYADASGQTYNCVFECESFPDWFEFAEKKCYPYSNGVSIGRPFFKNYTLKDGELVYNFNALIDNNNIAQKLPFFDNNTGLRKIDATHFNVYGAKNAVTEFNLPDKANVDCSLFAFGPIVNMRTYDIDDCKKVRISLIGNVEASTRYNNFIKTGEMLFNSYVRHQVICGNEYVEIEIDKLNNRYRYVANGYSLSYRDNNNKNWKQLTQKTYQSKCFSDWANIINAISFYIVKIGGKICYSFNTPNNPSNFLQMGCKIKIEKLA